MISEIESIGSDITKYESLMARMPGFSMKGEALKTYLLKMLKFGRILIESDGERIFGLVGFYANDMKSKVAYVSSFVVSQDVEGKGLARSMYKCFLGLAQSAGMSIVALEVCRTNLRALAFYQKMGLQVVGPGRDDKHWLMRGRVNQAVAAPSGRIGHMSHYLDH